MATAVPFETLPYLLAAGLMLLLAVWLLYLDASSRANRAFAAFLFFRALTMTLGVLRSSFEDPATVSYLTTLIPYAAIPVIPAVVWFASVYPRPRGPLARLPHGGWWVVGVVAVLEVVYLLDHTTVWTFGAGAGTSYVAAGRGFAYTDFGPLVLLVTAQLPVIGLVALLFARDFVQAQPGSRRVSLFLVLAGFLLNALFDGTLNAAASWTLLARGEDLAWFPWGWAFVVPPTLTLLPALVAVGVLLLHEVRTPGKQEGERWILYLAPFPVLTAVLLGALGVAYLEGALAWVLLGAWRLSLPLLVTYALVRHHLFDIDVKVKWTLRASTIGAIFLAVFFLAGELAEDFIAEAAGTWIGITAAVGLGFAFRPLERFSDRVVNRVMGDVKPVEEMKEDERHAFYREQAVLAWQDGDLGEKERQMLDRLRARLNLPEGEARTLEDEARRLAAA